MKLFLNSFSASNLFNYNSDVKWPVYLIYCVLAYFALFHHLDSLVVRFWDEGQNAVNAFEMIQRNSWFIKYYNGKPDLWETKPPFFIWHVIGFMKILGFSELAMRLPSALYTLFGGFYLIYFSGKYLQNRYVGLLAAVVVITSLGVIGRHNARTGDTDATLVFYLLLSTLSFFQFLHIHEDKKRHFWFFATSLFIAIFTKSIIGVIFLPGMFLYTVITGKLGYIFKLKDVYIAIPIFAALVAAYYWYHETETPGYITSLYEGELGGRYASGSKRFSFYYLKNFWDSRFTHWIIAVPLALSATLWAGNKQTKQLSLYLGLIVAVTLLVLSRGSKNLWYDAPLYPLMGLIIGIGFFDFWNKYRQLVSKKYLIVLPLFLLFVNVGFTYRKILKTTHLPTEKHWHREWYGCSYYLRNAIEKEVSLGGLKVAFEDYPSAILYYVHVLNLEKENNIKIVNLAMLNDGDTVLVAQKELKDRLKRDFKIENLDGLGPATRIRIESVDN